MLAQQYEPPVMRQPQRWTQMLRYAPKRGLWGLTVCCFEEVQGHELDMYGVRFQLLAVGWFKVGLFYADEVSLVYDRECDTHLLRFAARMTNNEWLSGRIPQRQHRRLLAAMVKLYHVRKGTFQNFARRLEEWL